MIKINLLGQKRVRRGGIAAARGARNQSQVLLFALLGVVALGIVGFFALHRPVANEVADLDEKNKDLTVENAALKEDTKDSRAIRAAFESELARQQATARLKEARVSPAWLMFELANVLTPGKQPQL